MTNRDHANHLYTKPLSPYLKPLVGKNNKCRRHDRAVSRTKCF